MRNYDSLKQELHGDLSIFILEIDRLTKIIESEDSDSKEVSDSQRALAGFVDGADSCITSVFSMTFFEHEGELPVEAYGELVVHWKRSQDSKSDVVVTGAYLVNSTRHLIVEVPVTEDNPETASVWKYAVAQVQRISATL